MLVCVIHADFPRFFQIGFEGVLLVSAAVLDNAIDFFQLRGIVSRHGDGFFVGVKYDTHIFSPFYVIKIEYREKTMKTINRLHSSANFFRSRRKCYKNNENAEDFVNLPRFRVK